MKRLLVILLLLAVRVESAPRPLRIERILRPQALGKAMEVVAEQAIVKFSSAVVASDRDAVLQRIGARRGREFPRLGWTVVDLSPGSHVADGIDSLRRLPGVESVQPNHVYHPVRVPSDPLAIAQSNLSQVDAFGAWDFETGGTSMVTVAVIDTGIQATHPDLAGKLDAATGLISQDCSCGACSPDSPPTAILNHGTLVAGIAAASANNGTGIAGMSWGAQLLSLKVFDGACAGGDDASIAAAIDCAVTQPGKVVINMSLGAAGLSDCPGPCLEATDCYSFTQTSIAAAVAAGVPVVVAAGNEYGSPIDVPANCPGALPVGSVDSLNRISGFTNRGPELASNGVVAPGEMVLSTNLNNSYGSESGTSFSAPHVAGLAALLLSAKPSLSPAQVQSYIRSGADDIGSPAAVQGAGRINAFRSLRLAVRGTVSNFDGDQKVIAFPNPFRPAQAGVVSFSIPASLQGANANIKIYTVAGEYVQTVTGLTWDGRNAAGRLVAAGTYIFVVSTDHGTTRGRVAVIR